MVSTPLMSAAPLLLRETVDAETSHSGHVDLGSLWVLEYWKIKYLAMLGFMWHGF